MMTTPITPLGLTGTKLTEMDILFRTISALRTKVQSITPKGYNWIRKNMEHKEDFTVTVQTEFVEELKDLMRKDGLNV